MIRKTTTQLLKELENFNTFEEYENANRDSMISKNLSEYLTDLLNERNLTKAEVIRKAELSDGYAYQIFSGLKTAPKRDNHHRARHGTFCFFPPCPRDAFRDVSVIDERYDQQSPPTLDPYEESKIEGCYDTHLYPLRPCGLLPEFLHVFLSNVV